LRSASLVFRAARHFLPLRASGWDVAVTPQGPRILEGNVWWDPTNYAPELLPKAQWQVLARATASRRIDAHRREASADSLGESVETALTDPPACIGQRHARIWPQ
jgi:hypothetical protein